MTKIDDIRRLIRQFALPGEAVSSFPSLRLRAATAPTPPRETMYPPAFVFVAQGQKRVVLGRNTLVYGAGDCLVVSVDLPVVAHVAEATVAQPYLAFALLLDPARIAELLLHGSPATEISSRPSPGMAVIQADDDLLDPIWRLLRLLDKPKDLAALGPMIEREIIWRLINGEQRNNMLQVGLANGRVARVAQAINWIRANYSTVLRIADLEHATGMSAPTLYRSFRAITMLSPLQYQKQVRLQEARARIVAGAKSVSEVGYEVGYDSASQFSREYKRFFGSSPTQDTSVFRRRQGNDERT